MRGIIKEKLGQNQDERLKKKNFDTENRQNLKKDWPLPDSGGLLVRKMRKGLSKNFSKDAVLPVFAQPVALELVE